MVSLETTCLPDTECAWPKMCWTGPRGQILLGLNISLNSWSWHCRPVVSSCISWSQRTFSKWARSGRKDSQQSIEFFTLLQSKQFGSCKNPPANAGDIRDVAWIPGSGRSPGGGHGNPLQYSCLGNPMDRGALWTTVHGVAKSHTWLNTHSCMVDYINWFFNVGSALDTWTKSHLAVVCNSF